MLVSNIDFNQALIEAKITAFAYGLTRAQGIPGLTPVVTLVGENETALRRAFSSFADWGCEDDGDVVSVKFFFRSNGSYQVAIGPEQARLAVRMSKQGCLRDNLLFVTAYVKTMDSAGQPVHDLAKGSKNGLAPILFGAATADFSDIANAQRTMKHLDQLPRLLKFRTSFQYEDGEPLEPFFAILNSTTRKPKRRESRADQPERYAKRRDAVIDAAFAVSRERIHRLGLAKAIRETNSFRDVSPTQVVQAAMNLTLSHELCDGAKHYVGLQGELKDRIWEYVDDRLERADGSRSLPPMAIEDVCRQIDLDVRHTLDLWGIPTSNQNFSSLQSLFRRKGFVHE